MATPFENEQYISLETFRKDGSGVKTPVWAAALDGKLVVVTDGTSFKVKRLRNDPRIRVAGCNASGKTIKTEWKDGTARILEDQAHIERAHTALKQKYGFQFRLLDFGAWIGRRMARRAWLELDLK